MIARRVDPTLFRSHPLFAGAEEVLRVLRRAGHEALLAGGCVRDCLLGRTAEDFDVATSAEPSDVRGLFSKTVLVGERFGTVGVLVGDVLVQVTTFRSEGPYRDGRHPDAVVFSDAKTDALRRDFTVNGLFADTERGEIRDYVGGLADLDRRLIRAIGKPEERFREDALRLLRAARFSAVLGFSVEKETQDAVRRLAPALLRVSAERIRDELMKLLRGADPAGGIRILDDLALLAVILPEIAAMRGVDQPREFHPEGDVFVHTLLVLEKLEPKEPILLLGALFHDVGKPPTFQVADRIRFNKHDKVGAQLTRGILRRLAFSNEEVEDVASLVEQHLQFAQVRQMREGKRRRFLRQDRFDRHLALHRADCLASHGKLDLYDFCRAELARLTAEDLSPKRLITGSDLIEMGFSPGPLFHEILDALEDEQLEGRVRSRAEAEAWVRRNFPQTT